MKKVLILGPELIIMQMIAINLKLLFGKEVTFFTQKYILGTEGVINLLIVFASEIINGSIDLELVKKGYGNPDMKVVIVSAFDEYLEEVKKTTSADLYLSSFVLVAEDIDPATEKELLALI